MNAADFASEWEAAWNSHDLDRIMAHYSSVIVFRSRKAIALTGSGELVGKADLRAYWEKALERQPDLAFRVTQVFAGHQMLTLTYKNHKGVHAAETLWFGEDGLVTHAAACHAQ